MKERTRTAGIVVENVENVDVYKEPGRFGGWPANHGIWSWGEEILVGFGRGYFKDLGLRRHAIDRERPEEHLLARSLDGGHTWTIEDPSKKGALIPKGDSLHGTEVPGLVEREWTDCPGGIDFTNPNFAMTLRMTNHHRGPSRFYYSLDRGHNWRGPFRLPSFRGRGVAARTDYVGNGRDDCLVFLTVAKADGREGRPVCARTRNGGKSFEFSSWIGSEPEGFSIMPSSVRLSPTSLLVAVRRREGPRRWVEAYLSEDDGASWNHLATPVPDAGEGNPPSLIRLHDGRLCLTYGYRAAPFGIRARLSSDDGRTWTAPLLVRTDGGGRDVGYPRTVQRPDGRIVTIYYFHAELRGDRWVAASIWNAPG